MNKMMMGKEEEDDLFLLDYTYPPPPKQYKMGSNAAKMESYGNGGKFIGWIGQKLHPRQKRRYFIHQQSKKMIIFFQFLIY